MSIPTALCSHDLALLPSCVRCLCHYRSPSSLAYALCSCMHKHETMYAFTVRTDLPLAPPNVVCLCICEQEDVHSCSWPVENTTFVGSRCAQMAETGIKFWQYID